MSAFVTMPAMVPSAFVSLGSVNPGTQGLGTMTTKLSAFGFCLALVVSGAPAYADHCKDDAAHAAKKA